MSTFEVCHGYKRRKSDLFSCLFMQGCLRRLSCFHKKNKDLHIEITKHIQASSVQYKFQADLHYNEFKHYQKIRKQL
jgi:hypothetical protein